jgi:hypothetical protein
MAKVTTKPRPWAKEDISILKTLGREMTTVAVIARKLKRSVAATYATATALLVLVGMRLLVMVTRVLVLLT